MHFCVKSGIRYMSAYLRSDVAVEQGGECYALPHNGVCSKERDSRWKQSKREMQIVQYSYKLNHLLCCAGNVSLRQIRPGVDGCVLRLSIPFVT